eukprot:scaffold434_cov186-Pinguiococcus_pyrenoidosus.AAC.64
MQNSFATSPHVSSSKFACSGRDRGLKKDLKGYWSDTLSSPFLSFGTDIDTNSGAKEREEQLFDIFNKNSGAAQHRHNAGEIATVNIISFLYELETLQEYALQRDRDIFSGLGNEDARPKSDVQNSSDPAPSSNQSKSGEETDRLEQNNDAEAKGDDIEELNISNGEDGTEVEDGDTANDSAEKAEQRKQKLLENLGNVRIHFLGADMASLLRKRKFQNLFDVIIFGTAGLSQLVKSSTSDENAPVQPETTEAFVRSDDLMKISKPDAKILFENGRNLAFLSGKQVRFSVRESASLQHQAAFDTKASKRCNRCWPTARDWMRLRRVRACERSRGATSRRIGRSPQQEPEPGAQQIDECCGPKGLIGVALCQDKALKVNCVDAAFRSSRLAPADEKLPPAFADPHNCPPLDLPPRQLGAFLLHFGIKILRRFLRLLGLFGLVRQQHGVRSVFKISAALPICSLVRLFGCAIPTARSVRAAIDAAQEGWNYESCAALRGAVADDDTGSW